MSSGVTLPVREARLRAEDALAYARASGDMNPLHYDEDHARDHSPSGRPIAHGMYTMSLAWRWVDDVVAGTVRDIFTEFRAPWSVGEAVRLRGTVAPDTDTDGDTDTGGGGRRVEFEVVRDPDGPSPTTVASGFAVVSGASGEDG